MPAVASWIVSVGGDGCSATGEGLVLRAASPAALLLDLAGTRPGEFLHLATNGQVPCTRAVTDAARAMAAGGIDATIGRIEGSDGRSSRHSTQIEAARYLPTAPGSIVVTGAALARAAAGMEARRPDRFWASDLAQALSASGLVVSSPRVFSLTAEPAPAIAERLPFDRAGGMRDDRSLILVYGRIEASVSLYFDGLPADLKARLRFLRPGDLFSDLGWLACAGLVVVVRDFEHMLHTGTCDLLAEIGVPFVWFTDDDLVALGHEEAVYRFYERDAVAAFLERAAGVVTTSDTLARVLGDFHRTVIPWPCVHDARLAAGGPTRAAGSFRVGVFGGAFRRESFGREVAPALATIGRERSVQSFVAGELARDAEATVVPFEPEYRPFIFQWRRLGLHAIAHPYGVSHNMANKSAGSILTSAYLGAVPIVGAEPAYAGLSEEQGVLVASPDAASWEACLRRLAEPREAALLFERLDAWCRTAFDPEAARTPFAALDRLAVCGGIDAESLRWQYACRSATLRRVAAAPVPQPPRLVTRLRRGFRKRWRRFRRAL